MPRIRKKTSNRATTHQRQKLKHKVSEGRKKAKKQAKKNPQWKSKQKKDIGIPNSFPFKDEVMAEVAEARRRTAEEKQKRKDAAKKKRATVSDAPADDEASDGDDEPMSTDQPEPETGIVAVTGSSKAVKAKGKGKRDAAAMDEDTEEPILIDPTLVDLAAVIERADALICVLDARDPQAYRSKTLEEAGKPVVFVVTKTDLVPREALSAWLSHLRASMSAPVILFKAASAFLPAPAEAATKQKSAPAPSTTDTLGAKALHAALNGLKAKTVAVVGPANVGKSSLINSLAKRTIQPIYDLRTSQPGPSTTLRPTLITVPSSTSESLTFIDTAGFVSVPTTAPADSEDANRERVKDILLRARGRIERIKEPLPVTAVSTLVSRAPAEDLMLHFNLPAFAAGSTTAFLNTLSKAKNCLTKTSTPDHNAAARVVLRDWSTGAFAWYTTPSAVSEILLKPTPEDQEVLDAVLPRKELRRARGSLARLTPSEIETRATDLHAKSGAGTDVDGGDRANKRAKIVRDADDEDDEMSDDKFDGNEEEDEEEDVDNVDDGEYKEDDEPSGYESDNNDTPIDTPASRKRAAKAAPTPKGKTSGKKVSFAAIATKKSATQPKRVANTRSATAAAA